jgi:hypothetical protein
MQADVTLNSVPIPRLCRSFVPLWHMQSVLKLFDRNTMLVSSCCLLPGRRLPAVDLSCTAAVAGPSASCRLFSRSARTLYWQLDSSAMLLVLTSARPSRRSP